MDRITQSLFEDFIKRFSLEGMDAADAFERFAAYCVLTPILAETFDPEDVSTGGGNDLGIDVIATLVNGRLVLAPDEVDELVERNRFLEAEFIFIQAKRAQQFNAAEIGNFLFGVKDFFAEHQKLPQNDSIKELVALQRHIIGRSADMTRGKPRLKLYYVTTGKWTAEAAPLARVNADLADLEALGLFSKREFIPVDADKLQDMYRRTRNKTSAEFTFTNRVVIPEINDVEQAYLGVIPGKEFLKLVLDDAQEVRKSAFYDNVRDFLDYNDVNLEIANTLRSDERDRFALLNNGVTVIAKSATAVANKFHVEDFQIVNGCQTSHVFADNKGEAGLENVYVPLRLIVTSDENVRNSIIKATNRQTEVKPDQLYALSDFQKKLEAYFETFTGDKRLYYERRSMQYADADAEKVRIVSIQQQIRVFGSMFLGQAHKGHYGRALASLVGKGIFAKNHRLEPYYVSAYAYYKSESLFRRKALDAKYKPARYHLLLIARRLFEKTRKSPGLPALHANEMQRFSEEMMAILWDDGKALALFKDSAKVLDQALKGRVLERSLTKTEGFTADVERGLK